MNWHNRVLLVGFLVVFVAACGSDEVAENQQNAAQNQQNAAQNQQNANQNQQNANQNQQNTNQNQQNANQNQQNANQNQQNANQNQQNTNQNQQNTNQNQQNTNQNQQNTNQNQQNTGENQQEGTPELGLPESISLTALVGETTDDVLVVQNSGDGVLDAQIEVDAEADWLTIDPENVVVAAGDEAEVTLTAACPGDEGDLSTEIFVDSDHSEVSEESVAVDLHCAAPEPAELTIAIDGLPAGEDGAVEITGPEEYDILLTETETLDGLYPGDYTISAFEVDVGNHAVYRPDIDTAEITLEPGETAEFDVEYSLVTGELSIVFDGLPGGGEGAATVNGPDGFTTDIEGDETLTELTPGIYEIVAADVEVDPAVYTADGEEIAVHSNEAPTATVTYDVITGSLELTSSGLPADFDLVASVEGPDAYGESFTEAVTIEDLEPGTYTVTFDDAEKDGVIYTPDPAVVTIEVPSGPAVSATGEYSVVDGALTIATDNLPADYPLSAHVDGPDYDDTVDDTVTIEDLEPGTYTVTFEDSEKDGIVYEPDPAVVTVDVLSGPATTATGEFSLVEGALTIATDNLPTDFPVSAHVGGPGFDDTVDDTLTIENLEPGEYTVTFDDSEKDGIVYEPDAPVVIFVPSGPAVTATGEFSVIEGTLTIAVDGLPDDFPLSIHVDGPDYDELISDAQTIEDLEPGTYTVTYGDSEKDGAIYEADPKVKTIDVPSEPAVTVTGEYEGIAGDLRVDSTGLPSDVELSADVEGPGYDDAITGRTLIANIDPGGYTVEYWEVNDGQGAIYRTNPDPLKVDPWVESDDLTEVFGHYEAVPGSLDVTVDFPGNPEPFELQILDAGGDAVGVETVANGDTVSFEDLQPEPHTLHTPDSIVDAWANEYLELVGFDDPVDIDSEQTSTTTISGTQPTLVQNGSDTGDHSLRDVVDRVNATSVITFADDVSAVTLSSGVIEIDKPLSIVGHDAEKTQLWANGDHRIFIIGDNAEVDLQSLKIGGGFHAGGENTNGGGAITTESALTLFDVELHDNATDNGRGGAIYADAKLTLDGVTAHGNTSTDTWGDGGVIFANDGLDATGLHFYDNDVSWWGGAIYAQRQISIADSLFEGNHADRTGGAVQLSLADGVAQLDRVLFYNNSAGNRGGALQNPTTSQITNSTFYQNDAGLGGGAINTLGSTSMTTLVHSTLVENVAPEGPAIRVRPGDVETPNVELARTLIADNGDDDQSELAVVEPFDEEEQGAPIASLDYNVISRTDEDTFDANTTDTVGTPGTGAIDAQIKYFGYNGGHPRTVSVLDDSPAHQAVPENECVDPNGQTIEVDQRGYARPVDGQCTIGAWEADPNLEDFTNSTLDGSYSDGSFVGNDGILWQYDGVKDESPYPIDPDGAMVRDPGAALWADSIPGGVDTLSIQYRKAWENSNPRQFEVLINDEIVETSPVFGDFSGPDDTVYTLVIDDLGIEEDFDVEIRRSSSPSANAQITFDNIRWK